MSSLNQVNLIGRLGRDPESRTFPSGDTVANVTIATSEKWKDRDGNKQERTEWHNLMFPSHLADIVTQYLRKGDMIFVEGKIQSRDYTDKDGVERKFYEIRCERMQMLVTGGGQDQRGGDGGRGSDNRSQGGGYQQRDNGGQRGGQGGGRGNDRGGQQRGNDGGGYQDRGRNDNRGQQRDADQQDRGRGQGGGGQGGYTGENNRGGGQARPPAQAPAAGPAPARGGSSGFDDMDDDIPF